VPPPCTALASATAVLAAFSQCQPYREYASECNYCRRPHNHGRFAYGTNMSRVQPWDYEDMLERNFIRSGSHIYQPSNGLACCPNIPIRCDALEFTPSAHQLRSLRKLRARLAGTTPIVLPATNTDAFGRLLDMAAAGHVQEAVKALCQFRSDGQATDSEGGHGSGSDSDSDSDRDGGGGGVRASAATSEAVVIDVGTFKGSVTLAVARRIDVSALLAAAFSRDDAAGGGAAAAAAAVATTSSGSNARARELLWNLVTLALVVAAAPVWSASLLPSVGSSVARLLETVAVTTPHAARKAAGAAHGEACACNAAFVVHTAQRGGARAPRDAAALQAVASTLADAVASAARAAASAAGDAADALLPTITCAGGQLVVTWPATASPAAVALAWLPPLSAITTAAAPPPAASAAAAAAAAAEPAAPAAAGEVSCLTAHTRAALRALRAQYRAQQAVREEAGKAQLQSDPLFPRYVNDDDSDLDSDDASGDEASGAAGGAGGEGGAAQPRSRAERMAAARAAKLAREVEDGVAGVEAYAAQGVGDQLRRLRAAAEAWATRAAISEAGGSGRGGGGSGRVAVPSHRMAALRGAAGGKPLAAAAAAAGGSSTGAGGPRGPLLPFGPGPHKLVVRMRPAAYSAVTHELYERFNMALHRGKPRKDSKTAYIRHLVRSPYLAMPAAALGRVYTLATGSVEDMYAAVAGDGGDDGCHLSRTLNRLAARLALPQLRPSATARAFLAHVAIEDRASAFLLHALARGHAAAPAVEEAGEAAPAPEPVAAAAAAAGGGGGSGGGWLRMPPLMEGMAWLLEALPSYAAMEALPLAACIVALFMVQDQVLADAVAEEARLSAAAEAAAAEAAAAAVAASGGGGGGGGEGASAGGAADNTTAASAAKRQRLEESTPLALPGRAPPAWVSTRRVQARFGDVLREADQLLLWLPGAVDSTLASVEALVTGFSDAGGGGGAAATSTASDGATRVVPASTALDAYFVAPGDADGGDGADGRIVVEGGDLAAGFGSFFHTYELDGEVVAVSVLDVLPTRVASIYFFYNPDFRYLELGRVSALVELWLTARMHAATRRTPGILGLPAALGSTLRWWDANFYVHACSSMNYKRQFTPSQLLCPHLMHGRWVPLTPAVLRKLDDDPGAPLATVEVPDGAGGVRLSDDAMDVATAGAVTLVEEAEAAEEAQAGALLQLVRGRYCMFDGLSETSKALLTAGMQRYVTAAGAPLVARVLVDPNWMASVAIQNREGKEAADRRAAARLAAATAAAATAASTPAAAP